jgi:hypothetical protein
MTLSPSAPRRAAGWSALLLLVATGCGQDRRGYVEHSEPLIPVTGVVMVDGKPARNARVVLHRPDAPPAGQPTADAKPSPRGECDDSGKFQIYTYAAYDGAPAGDYRVTISWKDPEGLNREGDTYRELLPAVYQHPVKSKLKASVAAGSPAELKFELKGKGSPIVGSTR